MKLTEIFENYNGENLVVKNKQGVTVAEVGQLVTDGIYQLLDLLESEGYSIQVRDK